MSCVSSVADSAERPGTPAWPLSCPIARTPSRTATAATLRRLASRVGSTGAGPSPAARWSRGCLGLREPQADGSRERREVDGLVLGDGQPDPDGLDPLPDELRRTPPTLQPRVQVRRPDGLDLCTAARGRPS